MAKNNNLTDFLTDVANAIRAKKGITDKINPQDFSSEIAELPILEAQAKSVTITENGTTTITPDSGYNGLSSVSITTDVASSGGGSVTRPQRKDANFYDYDGTLLYSYTASEFAALSAMPQYPEHAGLTCQGWNWSISDAKSFVSSYGKVDIGATYITDDGKTRLYINIASAGRMTVPLYFTQTVSGGVIIDWGDGSATETISGTGKLNTSHTYANVGEYCIALTVKSGTLGFGKESSSICVLGKVSTAKVSYATMLRRLEIGKGVTIINTYAFQKCYGLEAVVIPNSVTNINSYAFQYCYGLEAVVIPNSVTNSIQNYAFSQCRSLKVAVFSKAQPYSSTLNYATALTSVVLPPVGSGTGSSLFAYCDALASVVFPANITSVSSSVFSGCRSLSSLTFMGRISSISQQAFYNCYNLRFLDFSKCTSVPTLSTTNAFQSTPADCSFIVPDALYDSWIAATNWSTYSTQIIKKSDWDAQNT